MIGQNRLLEQRMDSLRQSLDTLSSAVDDNLRTVLLRLTCDEAVAGAGPLHDINELARTVRERCLLLVAREHPVANDLKYSMAALRVEHDYERIQDLALALNKRVERLRGTPMQDIIQDMTGVMADILALHEVVRRTWQRDRKDMTLPDVQGQVRKMADGIQNGVTSIQNKTLAAIEQRSQNTPGETPEPQKKNAENMVELVLACRHLKRIANLMETIPDELHSFDM